MRISRRKSLLGAAATSLALSWPRGAASEENSNELYEKAKAEGAMTLYAGGPAAPWEVAARRFEQRYPGIAVNVVGGFSNVINSRISEQIRRGAVEVDIASLQTAQDFMRWKQEGSLALFKPEGWDTIASTWKDPDGAFVAVSIAGLSYAYNPRAIGGNSIPASALDFLEPGFRGKIITCYPQDDDATLYLFDAITSKYGWDYWKRYMANQPSFVQGHIGVARSISAGDSLATFDTVVSISAVEKAAGRDHEIFFSTVDPTPLFASSAAIFRQAPHPNAARLFLTWYLSQEQQSRIGGWSPRAGLQPPPNLPPLTAFNHFSSYYSFVADETRLADLRQRFAAIVGPIVNTGGVR